MAKWYEKQGENSDIVIASQIKLARNWKEYPFSSKLSNEQAKQLVSLAREKLASLLDEDGSFLSCSLENLTKTERMALVERYLLSNEIVEKEQETGIILSKDEAKSILINGEDHLQIQVILNGMDMEKAFEIANQIDDTVCEQMEYAYDRKYGYLTSSFDNIGTGMRASYIVFLPALSLEEKIVSLKEKVKKYGIIIRNCYEEGKETRIPIYELSNQRTMGSSEMEIIENLNQMIKQIISEERKCRETILNQNFNATEDKIYRAYGILKYARKINTKDAMKLLSKVKFGFDTGILKEEKKSNIFKMMIEIQPNNLKTRIGKNLEVEQRDQIRAKYINEKLVNILTESRKSPTSSV